MNYCNFAKVIIARSTKDKNLLTWWENHEKNDADAGEISINWNCRNSNDVRYNMYHQIMHRFPKMYVPLSVFVSVLCNWCKILQKEQQEWKTQTICWIVFSTKLGETIKNCKTRPQYNWLSSMYIWLAQHVIITFVLFKRTKRCNKQLPRYDREFFKLNWYKNNDRCNQHCQSNGEHY